MPATRLAPVMQACAIGCLTALIALCLAWELWLAPLRAGGSWMALKVLPLLAPLFGVLHGRLYTYRWSAMLVLAYFIEGVVRLYAETGLSALLAGLEIALAVLFAAAAVGFVRANGSVHRRAAAPRH